MLSGLCVLLLLQNPAPGKSPAAAQAIREDRNPTVIRALEVIDSLLQAPPPHSSLSAADVTRWTEQNEWFRSLRDRLRNLLSLVQTPARVATPAPVEPKHVSRLQDEAAREAEKFTGLAGVLKTRHDVAMNAIRNMK